MFKPDMYYDNNDVYIGRMDEYGRVWDGLEYFLGWVEDNMFNAPNGGALGWVDVETGDFYGPEGKWRGRRTPEGTFECMSYIGRSKTGECLIFGFLDENYQPYANQYW